jgi:hypothetical protein
MIFCRPVRCHQRDLGLLRQTSLPVGPGPQTNPSEACGFHLPTLHFILLIKMFSPERNSSPIMDYIILPPEVFETILTYLDLDSVKALRLTDRKLAEMCIGPRFLGSIQ